MDGVGAEQRQQYALSACPWVSRSSCIDEESPVLWQEGREMEGRGFCLLLEGGEDTAMGQL